MSPSSNDRVLSPDAISPAFDLKKEPPILDIEDMKLMREIIAVDGKRQITDADDHKLRLPLLYRRTNPPDFSPAG